MPEIGIISFLHNDNYGSTLQAWSLQHALGSFGFSAAHLDYRPDVREKIGNMLKCRNSPGLLLDSFRRHKVKTAEAGAAVKAAAFRAFQQEEMQLLGPCKNQMDLASAAQGCRILICGSDQVWSPEWLNPAYFLTFAGENQPRIAYACSLGVSQLSSVRKQRLIASLLRGFSAISVREEEGASLLRKISPEIRVEVMPDPVFLTPAEEWMKLAAEPESSGKLVCCMMGENSQHWDRVSALSRETGLPVTVVPIGQLSYLQPFEKAAGLDPREWLGLLGRAAQICTDSFHCAAFALLLGKPVTILRRYRDGSAASKNSRIDQLLRSVGADGKETILPSPQISAAIDALREKGLVWLKNAVSAAMR